MSEKKKESPFSNPTVVAALITGFMGLLGIFITQLPNLLPKDNATATPLIVLIATTGRSNPTELSPTDSLAITEESATTAPVASAPPLPPTATTQVLPTIAPSALPAATLALPPNVLLLHDAVSFTLLNQSAGTLSLQGIVFRSSVGEWDAARWGTSLYTSLPLGQCLRLRDVSVGQRQPPRPCVDQIYGLIEVGGRDLFWLNVDTFEVIHGGAVIATCHTLEESCAVFIPQ